jgi:hypothetical protein
VDGHDAAVPLPRPRQEHLGCASLRSDDAWQATIQHRHVLRSASVCVFELIMKWSGAVGAGDKGLYTVYIFQLTGCISKNIAVQLACAFAMKVWRL